MSRKRHATLKAFFEHNPHITQTEMAERIGVSVSAMSCYVRRQRIPQPAIALRLAEECRVSLEGLLQKAS